MLDSHSEQKGVGLPSQMAGTRILISGSSSTASMAAFSAHWTAPYPVDSTSFVRTRSAPAARARGLIWRIRFHVERGDLDRLRGSYADLPDEPVACGPVVSLRCPTQSAHEAAVEVAAQTRLMIRPTVIDARRPKMSDKPYDPVPVTQGIPTRDAGPSLPTQLHTHLVGTGMQSIKQWTSDSSRRTAARRGHAIAVVMCVTALLFGIWSAAASASGTAQSGPSPLTTLFGQCPAVDMDTSCGYLIGITSATASTDGRRRRGRRCPDRGLRDARAYARTQRPLTHDRPSARFRASTF
jgi:hypothetical protein